ncbi:MAG: 23S rRNA (uridine(2552)-2'-O)-methyltransferase RlmE [Pseudomonadota bacterium]|nr:23S rRNA (uridine(2552)-2'-O)-methyltransferase RlmE [Pseudomonadota bacterium]
MARSKSSSRWLQEHFADGHVRQARREGYRSRAVYKLKEIHDRDRQLRPGMTVVDLGAAPGGWSQLAAERVGGRGLVVALDVLPMAPLPGVQFIQGDFRDAATLEKLLAVLGDRPVDLVISDMAPNLSGIKAVDQPRGLYLAELAVDFARQRLAPGGALLTKVFQGEGLDALVRELRASFATVAFRKPKASRSRSPEHYLLARNYRPG